MASHSPPSAHWPIWLFWRPSSWDDFLSWGSKMPFLIEWSDIHTKWESKAYKDKQTYSIHGVLTDRPYYLNSCSDIKWLSKDSSTPQPDNWISSSWKQGHTTLKRAGVGHGNKTRQTWVEDASAYHGWHTEHIYKVRISWRKQTGGKIKWWYYIPKQTTLHLWWETRYIFGCAARLLSVKYFGLLSGMGININMSYTYSISCIT